MITQESKPTSARVMLQFSLPKLTRLAPGCVEKPEPVIVISMPPRMPTCRCEMCVIAGRTSMIGVKGVLRVPCAAASRAFFVSTVMVTG